MLSFVSTKATENYLRCDVTEYNLIISSAEIAQLGERQTEDLKVPGSIPGFGISFFLDPHQAYLSPGLSIFIFICVFIILLWSVLR